MISRWTLFFALLAVLCLWLKRARDTVRSKKFKYGPLPGDRPALTGTERTVLILGGTGAVGKAVAVHLLRTHRPEVGRLHVLLAGRDSKRGEQALADVLAMAQLGPTGKTDTHRVSRASVDFQDKEALLAILSQENVHTVAHVAGTYRWGTEVLRAAIASPLVKVYVDVSDQLEVFDEALSLSDEAARADTSALLCAGAFPGMSNVLAVDCASRLGATPKDVEFNYFTSGLGGSGTVNLLITNLGRAIITTIPPPSPLLPPPPCSPPSLPPPPLPLGFGEEVQTVRGGQLRPSNNAGLGMSDVEFFVDKSDASYDEIGTVTCWAWPFPEVKTVPLALGISGNSAVRMGTAPHIWNLMTVGTAWLFPRSWWRSHKFSKVWADISEPTVLFTDTFLVPETHCIRGTDTKHCIPQREFNAFPQYGTNTDQEDRA
jgi:hypothetical protein